MSFAGIKKTVREALSEPAPVSTLSWGRIGSSFALLLSAYLVCAHLAKTGTISGIDWRGIAEYVTAPYAANKITTAVQSFSKDKDKDRQD